MFTHCLTGKLCLTGVAKVPRQVERLTWKKTKEGKKTDETTIKLYYEINVVQYKLKMTKKKCAGMLLTFHQGGEQRYVGGFPPSCW